MEFYDHPGKCCCDCGCNSCSSLDRSRSGIVLRSVKRKYDEFEEENKFIPGLGVPQNARVEIENECMALRETVVSQQETIQDLICELEEERNASSSAANETMSMILRLQREKAEIEMEAKQFKRFTEERITHDQQEISELEELLYKREHTIEALTCEIQAYKHRLMSYGLTEEEAEAEVGELCRRNEEKIRNPDNSMLPGYEIYPPLKCNVNNSHLYLDDYEKADDVDKHSFGGTRRSQTELKDLDRRINQPEKPARTIIQPDGECKKEIVGQSPRKTSHLRRSSYDSTNSPTLKERVTNSASVSPKHKKTGYSHLDASPNLKRATSAPEAGEYIINKVYTVDSTHQRATNGIMNSKTSAVVGGEDVEIQKLYARLHALETDRETMRQAIASMGADKAHLVLLKEIAQNLVKEMAPSRAKPVQERSIVKNLSFGPIYKWVASILLWRRKARRSKFTFGLSDNNAGLLSLIDRNPRVGSRKILYSANFRHL